MADEVARFGRSAASLADMRQFGNAVAELSSVIEALIGTDGSEISRIDRPQNQADKHDRQRHRGHISNPVSKITCAVQAGNGLSNLDRAADKCQRSQNPKPSGRWISPTKQRSQHDERENMLGLVTFDQLRGRGTECEVKGHGDGRPEGKLRHSSDDVHYSSPMSRGRRRDKCGGERYGSGNENNDRFLP